MGQASKSGTVYGKASAKADMWLLYDAGMRIPVILEAQEEQRGHRAMRQRLEGPGVAGIPRGRRPSVSVAEYKLRQRMQTVHPI